MKGIFLDTETNGLNLHKHVLVEIAFVIVDLLTGKREETFVEMVQHSPDIWKKSDKTSLKINGFTYEEVEKGLPEEVVQRQVIDCFTKNNIKRGEAVFICQNPSFDRAFFSKLIDPDEQERLFWPYHWLDLASMHFAKSYALHKTSDAPLPWDIGFSKDKIARHYNIPDEEKPHRALNGVNHLIQCYEAVIN